MKKRPAVGIVIDYSIRIPDFKSCYSKCKSEIISGAMSSEGVDLAREEIKKSGTSRDFWISLQEDGGDAYSFYEKTAGPQENFGPDFDYTYKKYFYNDEHRLRFLEDWSYNLFGQGSVTNATDLNMINICQSKICDVILIDRTTNLRKIPNTFAFLSRTQAFVKGTSFINTREELERLVETKELLKIYDAVENPSLVLVPGRSKLGEPSEPFLKWLMDLEKELNTKK